MIPQAPELNELLIMLSDGKAHELSQLAHITGSISSAVKGCDLISGLGAQIARDENSVKLADPFEALDVRLIAAYLQDKRIAPELLVTVMLSVGSTNELLGRLHNSERRHGMTYLAEHQSAGKGRAGRRWLTPLGGQVAMSTCLRFPTDCVLEGLSLAVGVAVVRTLQAHRVEELSLKWPNDVLLQGRKMAGILLQILPGEDSNDVIVGLGLNYALGQIGAQIDQPWADLKMATQERISRNKLAADLIHALVTMSDQFQLSGYGAFKSEWEKLNAHRGKQVVLSLGQSQRGGTMVGTDNTGAAVVMTEAGREIFHAGEMSLRNA